MFAGTGYSQPYAMPTALAELWVEASAIDSKEGRAVAAMLGGRWTAASVWCELEKLRKKSPQFRALLEHESKSARL